MIAAMRENIAALEEQATELRKKLDDNTDNDTALVDLRLQLETLSKGVLQRAVALGPRLREINARLEQLGAPPAEGVSEPEIVANERRALIEEKATINALTGQAEELSLQVSSDIERIGELRRELFTNTLTKRVTIDLTLAGEAFAAFLDEVNQLYRSVASWVRFVLRFKIEAFLGATFFALLAAAVIFIGGRRMVGRLIVRDPANQKPSYLSRVSVAFFSSLLPAAAILVFFIVALSFYHGFNVLRGDILLLFGALARVTTIVFLVHRLARAVLAPFLPAWRLVDIATAPARRLYWLAMAIALVTAFDHFATVVSEVLNSPLSVTVAKTLVASVLVGLLVFAVGLVKPFEGEDGLRRWPLLIRIPLFLLGASPILAAMLGYTVLARFVLHQIVVSGAIAVTMYIGFLAAQAMSDEHAFANTLVGRRIRRAFALDDAAMDRFGVAAGIVLNIAILVAGIPLILLQWGFQAQEIFASAWKVMNEVRIGSFSFSLLALFGGILVFIVGYFVTRWLQGWLDDRVMARGRVDAGVRNSIRTAIGYLGIAVAAMIGISAAGIDLSNFALVAGALSLGIGFGLQNIVNNFVSGLILLAERPFKSGDWIVAGAVQGTVKKISVRATEIETFQRQTIILPNSELINAAVGNWTHKNKLGRVEIRIGVAYGSDARKVSDILLELARNHPMVTKNPEPFVYFVDFGDSALIFELRVFLFDVLNSLTVQNDIRFALYDRLKAEGIEIPFPQRDIHVKAMPAEAFDIALPAEQTSQKAVAKRSRRSKPDPDAD